MAISKTCSPPGGQTREAFKRSSDIIVWLKQHGISCSPLVSPPAIVSEGLQVGAGAFVAQGVIVKVSAQLGRSCVVNTAANIGHDAATGDNKTISPTALIVGRCTIGKDSVVGPLAKVLQGLKIGERTTIGISYTMLREDATVWPRPDSAAPTGNDR